VEAGRALLTIWGQTEKGAKKSEGRGEKVDSGRGLQRGTEQQLVRAVEHEAMC
jgi:hypothetical protein